MTLTTSLSDSDPFASNSDLAPGEGEYSEGATLPVGRDASLTLATDALIVLGERCQQYLSQSFRPANNSADGELARRETSNCCGLLPSSTNAP